MEVLFYECFMFIYFFILQKICIKNRSIVAKEIKFYIFKFTFYLSLPTTPSPLPPYLINFKYYPTLCLFFSFYHFVLIV